MRSVPAFLAWALGGAAEPLRIIMALVRLGL